MGHVINRVGSVVVMTMGATFFSVKEAIPPTNSPSELLYESPGILLVEFWNGHISISHDNSAGFQEERHVRPPSISQGINVASKLYCKQLI